MRSEGEYESIKNHINLLLLCCTQIRGGRGKMLFVLSFCTCGKDTDRARDVLYTGGTYLTKPIYNLDMTGLATFPQLKHTVPD